MSVSKKVLALAVGMVTALSVALVGCSPAAPSSSSSGSSATSGAATPAAQLNLVKPGTLTVGSDCDYPPFIALEGSTPVGFEYEMMEAIAAVVGLEVEYLPPQNFDSILASVAAGTKMDVGVSSFTITSERKELVDFTLSYFDSNQAVVALKSKGYTSAMDLNGKVVGSQSGTTGSDWVNENLKAPGTVLKEFNQTSEALAAMMAGDIEAVFFDEPVAAEQVKTTYTDAEIVESIATGELYGIAVSKTNTSLREQLDAALSIIKADGTFDKIFLKYFPDLTPPTLKAA